MPVTTVLLAAGLSSRMGKPKLLLPHPLGRNWGEHLVSVFGSRGDVLVVVNRETEHDWASKQVPGTTTLVNPAPELGLFSSVALALPFCSHDSLLYLHPVDCPFWDDSVLDLLQASASEKANFGGWWSPTFQGKRGHPSLLSAAAVQTLRAASPNSVLRDQLALLPCFEVPCASSQILWNLNSQKDVAVLWDTSSSSLASRIQP